MSAGLHRLFGHYNIGLPDEDMMHLWFYKLYTKHLELDNIKHQPLCKIHAAN